MRFRKHTTTFYKQLTKKNNSQQNNGNKVNLNQRQKNKMVLMEKRQNSFNNYSKSDILKKVGQTNQCNFLIICTKNIMSKWRKRKINT